MYVTVRSSHSTATLLELQLMWRRKAVSGGQVLHGVAPSDCERPITSPALYAKGIHSQRKPVCTHFIRLVSSILETGLFSGNGSSQTRPVAGHFWAGSEPGLGREGFRHSCGHHSSQVTLHRQVVMGLKKGPPAR